jgi:FKBP-type peptidyl-prolyl cis-trans isomerase SlpA
VTPSSERIRPGSRVRLHLSVHLADGTEVLSTFDAEPMELRIGDGTLAPGLESLLLGLRTGDDDRVLADGAAVYGEPDPELIQTLDRRDLPADFAGRPGEVYSFDTPGGQQIAGTIAAADADSVQVDFNHPLCRRGLSIRVRILSVD